MEKYEITKEQILELENGFTLPKLKQWFPDAFKTELEVGKWYRNLDKGYKKSICCVIELHGDNHQFSGYGLDYKKEWFYGEDTNQCGSENWIEATEQEVKTALVNEAVKIGYKENLQYVKCLCGFNEESTQEYYSKKSNFYFEYHANKLWIQDGSFLDICIFDNGNWAEIIPTLTKKEAEEKLGVKII